MFNKFMRIKLVIILYNVSEPDAYFSPLQAIFWYGKPKG